jgi:hypothetical protein
MLMWPDVGMRVFCKRSKVSAPGELAAARLKAKDAEDRRADVALAEILATTPRVKPGIARARLASLGYRRGNDWVVEAMTRAKAHVAQLASLTHPGSIPRRATTQRCVLDAT